MPTLRIRLPEHNAAVITTGMAAREGARTIRVELPGLSPAAWTRAVSRLEGVATEMGGSGFTAKGRPRTGALLYGFAGLDAIEAARAVARALA